MPETPINRELIIALTRTMGATGRELARITPKWKEQLNELEKTNNISMRIDRGGNVRYKMRV